MSLRAGLVCLIAVACAWPTSSWANGAVQSVEAGARVVSIDANPKKPRATIDKGKKAGLKVGDPAEVYLFRVAADSKQASVDWNVRLATAKVIEVKDTTATLALDAIADVIEPGAYVSYKVKASQQLLDSELFRVTALGIELRAQYEDKVFITLEQMLVDPSEQLRDRALDAMIADVKAMRGIVADALKDKIQEGEHHGKTGGQIVDALDREQLHKFLRFVEAYPGKYIGNRWKLPEVYFTWVINGTPSGDKSRKQREVRQTLSDASDAITAGKLADARRHYQAVLKIIPDHKDATDTLKKIDQIEIYMRTVAMDPDNTAIGYSLANELFNLGAFTLSMAKLEPLKKRKYDPFKTERLRAYNLVRLKKFAQAEAIFKKLKTGEHADDANLAEWITYTHAHGKVARRPDAASYLELAEVSIGNKSWDSALTNYRKVLALPRATAKQREIAKQAQQRISLQKEVDFRVEWAKGDIKKHDLKGARERIDQALRLWTKLGDDKQAATVLDELASLANTLYEEELALELLAKRVQQEPTSMKAHAAIMRSLLDLDRLDEAEAAAKKSLEQKGDPAYTHLLLAWLAHKRDNMGEMEKAAQKATVNSPKYSWPLLHLARAAAAKDDWEDALVHAKKALDLDPEQTEMRSTHMAVHRGLAAQHALQSNASSARERIRLVRALAELGLVRRTTEEIAKLPADGTWRTEGWWALATSVDSRVPLKDRLTAARNAKPTLGYRKVRLEQLELRDKLRANPKDDTTRIALAKNYLVSEDFDRCLATLGTLLAAPKLRPDVGDIARDGRLALALMERWNLADAAFRRRDFDASIRLAFEVQVLADRLGVPWYQMTARGTRAAALGEKGKYQEALALLDESRTIAAATGDRANVLVIEQNIGSMKANVGTNDARRAALEESLKVCEETDAENNCYYVLLQLVSVEQDEGHSAIALEYARRAWNLAEKLGRADLARSARFELANANLTTNRFTDAEQIAATLIADSRKANDIYNEQLSLMVLGYVHMMRGQGDKARAHFQEVYDLGIRTGDTTWRALARRFVGSAWLHADHDAAKAAVTLQQADDLYKSLGDGWALSQRGYVLRDLADAYVQSNKLPQARKAADEALVLAQKFQRRPQVASALWMLALVAIKENKPDEALTRAQTALAAAQKTDNDALLWNAWHALAKANELKSNQAPAIDAYEKALEFLGRALQSTGGSDTEKQAFMSTGRVREVYADAVALFLKAGNTQRAMEILELSRDAMLKQQFDPTKVQTKDAKLRAKLDKFEESRARVMGLQKQLDKAMDKSTAQHSASQVKALSERIAKTRAEMNQVVLDLKVTHRHLFQALAMDPQNLVGRADQLPAGSVLVSYFVADDALYAFIIAASLKQPAVVRVNVGSAELEKAIEEWREALVAENEKIKQRDKVEQLGRKLDDWLLEPLRPHLEGATSVILLPFGPLYYVPFDALVVSEPGQPVKYAIEDFRISIQTATTLEHLLKPGRPRGTGTMLAISNPDGSLPGAQAEVSRIVKTALPDARVLVRNQATVKSFRDLAGNFRYLHLATHGILDADPRKSYMKMSDGGLTVQMISQLQGLDTSNEMVVLSACDTAVEAGKSTGDELVSVAVAFSMAGSPALVASLWEVGDDSTAELMGNFYRALEGTKGDRLDALREAKLSLLRMQKGDKKPFAQPWHWSSFQMYGDYRAPTAK